MKCEEIVIVASTMDSFLHLGFGNDQFLNRLASCQMLVNNPFQVLFCAVAIPDSLGIHDCDWAICANPKAVDFAAMYHSGFRCIQFRDSGFQVVPGFDADFWFTAFGQFWVGAQEYVTFGFVEFQLPGFFFRKVGHVSKGWSLQVQYQSGYKLTQK